MHLEILPSSLRRVRPDEPSPTSTSEAFDAIQELSPEHHPALIEFLAREDGPVHCLSEWLLRRLCPEAAGAAPVLLRPLQESWEETLDAVIPLVGIMTTQPKPGDQVTFHPDPVVTVTIALALGGIDLARTVATVQEFQRSKRLTPDGEVGRNTMRELDLAIIPITGI